MYLIKKLVFCVSILHLFFENYILYIFMINFNIPPNLAIFSTSLLDKSIFFCLRAKTISKVKWHKIHGVWFGLVNHSWARGLSWSVVVIHSDILLKKIYFPLSAPIICEQLLVKHEPLVPYPLFHVGIFVWLELVRVIYMLSQSLRVNICISVCEFVSAKTCRFKIICHLWLLKLSSLFWIDF